MICIIAKSFLSLRHRVVCYGQGVVTVIVTPLQGGYPLDPNGSGQDRYRVKNRHF